jgi:hypothetical protein
MEAFPAGKQVSVTVQLTDLSGNPLTPTAVSARVVDESGTEVVAQFSVTPTGASATIVVEGPSNLLSVGQTAGIRTVKVAVSTNDGSYNFDESYILKVAPADALVVLVNSFQTFNQAVLTAAEIPGLKGWDNELTTDELRIAALTEAYRRIIQIGMNVRWPRDVDAQTYLTTTDWIGDQTRLITPEYWQFINLNSYNTFYPEHFRQALRRAQVAEADDLLSGDPIEERRRMGLLSETIKDSSMMFRSGKPLDLGVSAKAFAYLRGYVQFRKTLGRS